MRYCLFVAFFLLVACAESIDPKAHFDTGNYKKSYQLWLPMAEAGDPIAQNYLGIHHYLGLGKPRDYRKAKNWFEKAAADGLADAQYNLGTMYENGEYVEIDYMRAYMWLFAAHTNGNTNAANRMWGITGDHKLFGNQVALAEEQAQQYIKRK